ncbi:hypothetical protein BT69DRAFT_1294275 [Atractiella rhizophila]|nr:hypothetical protein BT69DRAFT_1294275 [Atractiella rhizophila]
MLFVSRQFHSICLPVLVRSLDLPISQTHIQSCHSQLASSPSLANAVRKITVPEVLSWSETARDYLNVVASIVELTERVEKVDVNKVHIGHTSLWNAVVLRRPQKLSMTTQCSTPLNLSASHSGNPEEAGQGWLYHLNINNPMRVFPYRQAYPSFFFTSTLKSLILDEAAYSPSLRIESAIASAPSLEKVDVTLKTQDNCSFSLLCDALAGLEHLEELQLRVHDYLSERELARVASTFLEPIIRSCTKLRILKIQRRFLGGLRKGRGALEEVEVDFEGRAREEDEEILLRMMVHNGVEVKLKNSFCSEMD